MIWPLDRIQIFPSATKKASRWLKTAWFCHKIVPIWRRAYLRVFTRALRVCRQRRFEPYEAYRLGLFRPGFDDRCCDNLISRKALTKIQKRFNPENFAELAKNKGLFHYHCLEHGIPVPRLYLLCSGKPKNWQFNGEGLLCSSEEKRAFIEEHLPQTFVIKPLFGAYGKAVYVFCREDHSFVDHLGKYRSSVELCAFIEQLYPDGFIVQQKIENHPSIVALTDCRALQTMRIITFVADRSEVRLLHAHFKPITRPGIVIDTYIEGMTGNVEVPVEVHSGILGQGNQIVSAGRGIIIVSNHPVTGKSFAGFELPLWRDACELVKKAAIDFLPLRTIGWDVALAPDRPYLIEANVWWDPPNQHRRMDEILKQMQEHFSEKSPDQ